MKYNLAGQVDAYEGSLLLNLQLLLIMPPLLDDDQLLHLLHFAATHYYSLIVQFTLL